MEDHLAVTGRRESKVSVRVETLEETALEQGKTLKMRRILEADDALENFVGDDGDEGEVAGGGKG